MIQTRRDHKRGCGWRQPGGLYLVAEGPARPCGLLPIELMQCPTCGAGIKATRAWQWIDPRPLVRAKLRRQSDLTGASADRCTSPDCATCYSEWGERCGLLWIGGKFYPTPDSWTREAKLQGVCRRIVAVPRGFELGKTWCLVAHRALRTEVCPICSGTGHCIDEPRCVRCGGDGTVTIRGIFHAFRPRAIEYVVTGTETNKQLTRMIERGITPVRIERIADGPLLAEAAITDGDEYA